MTLRHLLTALALGLLGASLLPAPLAAADEAESHDPLYLGWGSEPAMEDGGRVVASFTEAISRGLGSIHGASEHPGLATAWEIPLGVVLILVQHEVVGHGGRAREFNLDPSYGFNFDLSAYTNIRRDPRSNEETTELAAGGAEADGVMAHRLLIDFLRPEGAEASKLPLALMAKLDLSLYVAQTPKPEAGGDFIDRFNEGNDVAIYLVARQARRLGADPSDVWNRRYNVDFDERLLRKTWDAARVAAVWNVLDPSLVAAVVSYFKDHAGHGATRLHPFGLRVGEGYRLSVGTRAALGAEEVSRFLDVYLAAPWGVFDGYVRDLDSSIDRSWGAGLTLHGLKLGKAVELSVGGDWWQAPDSREKPNAKDGWNLKAEVAAQFTPGFGLSAHVGTKEAGFFPGLPIEKGTYAGFGVLFNW